MGKDAYLGVDLGGTNVLTAVVGQDGCIIARGKKRTTGATTREALLETITSSIDKALGREEAQGHAPMAIGIGAPGPVDTAAGVVVEMPNIPVGSLRLKEELENRYHIPCFVENDVNVGTFGEFWRGAGRGYRDMVGVFVGTGTGGGIIIDGKIHRGKTGMTGEIGHIVLDPKGPLCGCGRAGCLEALASRTAMQRAVREALNAGEQTCMLSLAKGDPDRLRSQVFRKALSEGDRLAKQVIHECAMHLGYGAVTLIHLLSPECIVFGGGVMEALADDMLPTIRKVVKSRCLKGTSEGIAIVAAQLGDDAGVLGAAAVAMQTLGVLPE